MPARQAMPSPRGWTGRPRGVLGVAAAQFAVGAVLVARPRPVTARIAGSAPAAEPPTWLVRVLGLRMAAQAACEAVWPTRRVARWGARVDTLHAASMIAAAGSDRFRRAALCSAAIAAASAAALQFAARSARPEAGGARRHAR